MAFGAKIKLSVDTSSSASFKKQVQNLVNSAAKDAQIKLEKFDVKISNPESLLNSIQSQINGKGLTVTVKEFDTTGAVSKLRADLSNVMKGLSINGLTASLKSGDLTGGLDVAISGQKQIAQAAAEGSAQIAREKAALQELNNIRSTLNSAYQDTSKISDTNAITNAQEKYRELITLVEKYKADISSCTSENISNLAKETTQLKQNTQAVLEIERAQTKKAAAAQKAAAAEQAANTRQMASERQVVNLLAQIERYINSNSKAYKAYSADFDSMLSKLRNSGEMDMASLESIRTEFAKLKAVALETGNVGSTAIEKLKKGWEKFGGWSIVTGSMMKGISTIKQMVSAVTELDTAMTELKKVTDLSDQAYANYMDKSADIAKSIGATMADTISATADYARLGYDLDTSSDMAQAALVYKNVGDGIDDISEATESLISTIKAFGDGTYEAMEIVDKFNEVGKLIAQRYSNVSLVSSYIG